MEFSEMLIWLMGASGLIWATHSKVCFEGVMGQLAKGLGRDAFLLFLFIEVILVCTTYFDFTTFLLFLSIFSLICWGVYKKVKAKELLPADSEALTFLRYWGPDGFWIIFVIFILRGFIGEAYRIPSGSMKPGLQVGDFVIVNKLSYGIHMPISNKEIYHLNKPERGDVIIFRYPPEPAITYIKRIVGLPGDTIEYQQNQLFVNGEPVAKKYIGMSTDSHGTGQAWAVTRFIEEIGEYKVEVFNQNETGRLTQAKITVPADKFFVLGDNRDDSGDSRQWGFVHRDNIYGRATHVAFSFDFANGVFRKDRFWQNLGSDS